MGNNLLHLVKTFPIVCSYFTCEKSIHPLLSQSSSQTITPKNYPLRLLEVRGRRSEVRGQRSENRYSRFSNLAIRNSQLTLCPMPYALCPWLNTLIQTCQILSSTNLSLHRIRYPDSKRPFLYRNPLSTLGGLWLVEPTPRRREDSPC